MVNPASVRQDLSPRVRGNHASRSGHRIRGGSIPACAGEPAQRRCGVVKGWVYPRVCGGTRVLARRRRRFGGLSPRVRGNPALLLLGIRLTGSIPACAGEPSANRCPNCNTEVYPRVCGGTPRKTRTVPTQIGLSPRVRGNRWPAGGTKPNRRSIPACAGEPAGIDKRPGQRAVYPRVCGGTTPEGVAHTMRGGLSPRVRGNPTAEWPAKKSPRSIPACAGEPHMRPFHTIVDGVYPRVCGGTARRQCAIISARGLSPRVRGNPRPFHHPRSG